MNETMAGNIKFRHHIERLPNGNPDGGFTLCGQMRFDPNKPELGAFAEVSVARCNNKDMFSRSKGRLISEGRLHKGMHVFCVHVPTATDPNRALGAVLRDCEAKLLKELDPK